MKKKQGKNILKKIREKGLLNDKPSFDKQYKKVEERLENETNDLKNKNNAKLISIDSTFYNPF